MHLIVYVSTYKGDPSNIDDVMEDIVRAAKRENMKHAITGVLFFVENHFLQIIEGNEAHLRQLMKNIEADARHANVEYLIDTAVATRGFSQWNMDGFNLKKGRKFDPHVLKNLTKSFQRSLMPRSNMLAFYYQTLLNHQ